MTIFSLDGDLVEEIKKHICEFFACHSFGTRQSKGFGCFYPIEIKCDNETYKIPCCCNEIKKVAKYKFTTKDLKVKTIEIKTKNETREVSVFEQLFDYIDCFHKLIRSGINNKSYHKSLMYFYAIAKGLYWDKPQIRHYFGLKGDSEKPLRVNYLKKCGKIPAEKGDWNCPRKSMINEYGQFGAEEPYKFTYIDDGEGIIPLFRDALGLSSSQSWKYYSAKVEINDSENDSKKRVERFGSPLFYRPVKNVDGSYTVYIIINKDEDVFNRLKQATFEIKGSITNPSGSNQKYISITPNPLKARIYNEFDLEDYLEFVYEAINNTWCKFKEVRKNKSWNDLVKTNKNESLKQIQDTFSKVNKNP